MCRSWMHIAHTEYELDGMERENAWYWAKPKSIIYLLHRPTFILNNRSNYARMMNSNTQENHLEYMGFIPDLLQTILNSTLLTIDCSWPSMDFLYFQNAKTSYVHIVAVVVCQWQHNWKFSWVFMKIAMKSCLYTFAQLFRDQLNMNMTNLWRKCAI